MSARNRGYAVPVTPFPNNRDAVMSHTPGPWTVERWPTRYPDLFTYNVNAPQGWTNEQGQFEACGVVGGLDSAADAQLIAMAPDLLRALRSLTQIGTTPDGGIVVGPQGWSIVQATLEKLLADSIL